MKFVLCLIVAAVASQASAQLRCVTCQNCATVPANRQVVTCEHPARTTIPSPTVAPTNPPPLPQEGESELDSALKETPTQRRRRTAEEVNPFSPVHFSCFRVRVTATQVNRGCVANGGNTNQTCNRAANFGNIVEDCHICSSNECNSSSSLVASVFAVIASVFVALRMH